MWLQGWSPVASYHRAQIFYPMTNGLMTWWQILISAFQTQLGNCSGLPGHAGGDEHTSPGKHQGKKAGECPGEEVASQRKRTL
jgi:hypothetical protein